MLEAVDGRGKLLDRPAEPLAFLSWMYLRCRGESPWLGSENHTCLTECPLGTSMFHTHREGFWLQLSLGNIANTLIGVNMLIGIIKML